jgi:hypothetical protein
MINFPLKCLLDRLPNSPTGKSQGKFKDILSNIRRRWFFQRDIGKAGLTIPHDVIQALFRGIYKDYPDLRDRAIKFYSNITYEELDEDSGETIIQKPKRGHFLGMWTEGMTLLQYCIDRIVCSRIGVNSWFSAFNDDNLVAFEWEKDVVSYQEADTEVCEALGLIIKHKKTGYSYDGFYYLELYYDGRSCYSKENIFSLGILGAKTCVNITHAKYYVNGVTLDNEMTRIVTAAISEVVAHWGYEFYETEYLSSFRLGGWITPYMNGVDNTINSRKGYYDEYRALIACAERPIKVKYEPGTAHTVLGKELKGRVITPPSIEFCWELIGSSKKALQEKYLSFFSTRKGMIKLWSEFFKRRVSVFKKADRDGSVSEDYINYYPYSVPESRVITENPLLEQLVPVKIYTGTIASIILAAARRQGEIDCDQSISATEWDIEFMNEFKVTEKHGYCGNDTATPELLSTPLEIQEAAHILTGHYYNPKSKNTRVIKGVRQAALLDLPLSFCHHVIDKMNVQEELLVGAYHQAVANTDQFETKYPERESVLENYSIELARNAGTEEILRRIRNALDPPANNQVVNLVGDTTDGVEEILEVTSDGNLWDMLENM